MVRAHLAFLLLGLGATQALIANDDRNRHWAEGVYFPPVTNVDVVPQIVIPPQGRVQPPTRQQNPWSMQSRGGIYNMPQAPQSYDLPTDHYNPYQIYEKRGRHGYSAYSNLYVPEYYSWIIASEYDTHPSEDWQPETEILNAHGYYRDRYLSSPYNGSNMYTKKHIHSGSYDYNKSSSHIMDVSLQNLIKYSIPYSYTTSDDLFHSGPYPVDYGNEEYTKSFFLPGLILPLPDVETSLLPLW